MEEKLSMDESFRAEKLYYISFSVVKSMLGKGIIDEETAAIMDEKLLEIYRPVSGMLLAGKPFAGEGSLRLPLGVARK